MKTGPLELTAAPIVPAVEVTRENWRDLKSDTVRVMIADDAETVLDNVARLGDVMHALLDPPLREPFPP